MVSVNLLVEGLRLLSWMGGSGRSQALRHAPRVEWDNLGSVRHLWGRTVRHSNEALGGRALGVNNGGALAGWRGGPT